MDDSEEESITLLLNEQSFKVNRLLLIKKSRYFASLFLHNFLDSKDKEIEVKFDIDPDILQVRLKS